MKRIGFSFFPPIFTMCVYWWCWCSCSSVAVEVALWKFGLRSDEILCTLLGRKGLTIQLYVMGAIVLGCLAAWIMRFTVAAALVRNAAIFAILISMLFHFLFSISPHCCPTVYFFTQRVDSNRTRTFSCLKLTFTATDAYHIAQLWTVSFSREKWNEQQYLHACM